MALALSATVWWPIAENPQSAPTRLYPFDVTGLKPEQSPPMFPASIDAASIEEVVGFDEPLKMPPPPLGSDAE